MKNTSTETAALTGQTYAALRLSGASPMRACAELGVSSGRGQGLEALFRVRRPGRADHAARPRSARDAAHVAAAQAAGGFPVLR